MEKCKADITLQSLDQPTLASWVHKPWHAFNRVWVKHWCVLSDTVLYFFRSNKSQETCKGYLPLHHFSKVQHDPTFRRSSLALVFQGPPFRHAAETNLKTKYEPVTLYFEGSREFQQWLTALQQVYVVVSPPSAPTNIVDLVMQRLDYQHAVRPSFSFDEQLPQSSSITGALNHRHCLAAPIDTSSLCSDDSYGASQEMGRPAYRSLQLPSIGKSPVDIFESCRPGLLKSIPEPYLSESDTEMATGVPGVGLPLNHHAPVHTCDEATLQDRSPSLALSRVAPSPPPPSAGDAEGGSSDAVAKSTGPLAKLKRRFSQSAPLDYEKYLQFMRARLHSQAQQSQSTADKAVAVRKRAEHEANKRLQEIHHQAHSSSPAVSL
ncbi:hypothetical protein IWQ61_003830 [Dispira simplex]|nr:hypothetical protein IWQ61_003830 [Dispira simplex]